MDHMPVLSDSLVTVPARDGRDEGAAVTVFGRITENLAACIAADGAYDGDGFEVTLEKPSQRAFMGVRLDVTDGVRVQIIKVFYGLVGNYSDRAPAERQTKAGSFITRVNGIAGDAAAMVEVIQQAMTLKLKVVPAAQLTIKVQKEPKEALGLTFSSSREAPFLVVMGISEGCIAAYNRRAAPSQRLLLLDRITAVNGFEGTPEELAGEIDSFDEMELTLVRPQGYRP